MLQKWAIFLLMLSGLCTLVACSSASGGRSTPAPTATLTANPTSFTAGQGGSTLTFTATNADSGSIDNGVGPVGTNSHVSVTPAVTTTYTYTATGPGGSATAKATVTVVPAGPAPTVTLAASPASIVAGQSVTLTWTSVNATSVVIDNITSSSCSVPPCAVNPVSGGSVSASPTQTTTYTATATGNGQQSTATTTVNVSALNSFEGMPEPASAFGSKNPNDVDAFGAIGTTQFMEYVNTQYQAYDKTTFAPVWSTPQQIYVPWQSPANVAAIPECDAPTAIQLDAVVNFDRLASRWVVAGKTSQNVDGHYYFCIAVSTTEDASSPWNAYFMALDTALGTSATQFPDWPKLGTWAQGSNITNPGTDAYYVSFDLQDTTNSFAEVAVGVCALDRDNMLAGNVWRAPQCFLGTNSLLSNGLYLGHSLIPADIEGTTPPPVGRDEFMVSIENPTNDGTTLTSTTFNLWDFHVDWLTPANSTFALVSSPPVTTYEPGCYLFVSGFPGLTNCVPEYAGATAPPGQTVDSLGDRFMPHFSYRYFPSAPGGAYESFLVSHTIQVNPNTQDTQTGIRWYELRDNGTSTPALFQEGTISPDTSLYRYLPSIAQDKDGNAAVGYSFSNGQTYPGIDFSYWNLGTSNATTSEVTILNGTAGEITLSPVPNRGEWGTYTSMTVDPVDECTFWYVNEYWPTSASWSTRIANFKVPNCQ